MSDSPAYPDQPSTPSEPAQRRVEPAMPLSRADDVSMPESRPSMQRLLMFALLALSAAGLISSVLLWQKLSGMQEELARRSLDSGAQAIEARTLARAAQASVSDISARLSLQESRITEVSLQRAQLEQLMQSLSRSRDENLVVDIESDLRLAQQQAQLAGSAEPLIAALTSADLRIQRAAQPRLASLQRAIAKDTDRIRAASLTDVPALMLKIDELARLVDDLPLANAMIASGVVNGAAASPPARSAPAPSKAASSAEPSSSTFYNFAFGAWTQRLLDALQEEARKLLRVSRIDQPEAALVSPEQSFFLRENLKLRLLNARLALLSRQTASAKADLQSASTWLGKYFDPASRRTQTASQLLQQVQSQLKTSELPRLDDTLAALATAAAGR